MAVGMVELHGAIQRTQDYTAIKHQENAKPTVDQANFQTQMDKRVEEKHTQVLQGDDTTRNENHADAREKGKNSYAGDGGANRKKKDNVQEGKVVLKGKGVSHFDMSV